MVTTFKRWILVRRVARMHGMSTWNYVWEAAHLTALGGMHGALNDLAEWNAPSFVFDPDER